MDPPSMISLSDYSIQSRIWIGFGSLITLLLIMGAGSWFVFRGIELSIGRNEAAGVEEVWAESIRSDVEDMNATIQQFVATNDVATADAVRVANAALRRRVASSDVHPVDAEAILRVDLALQRYTEVFDALVAAGRERDRLIGEVETRQLAALKDGLTGLIRKLAAGKDYELAYLVLAAEETLLLSDAEFRRFLDTESEEALTRAHSLSQEFYTISSGFLFRVSEPDLNASALRAVQQFADYEKAVEATAKVIRDRRQLLMNALNIQDRAINDQAAAIRLAAEDQQQAANRDITSASKGAGVTIALLGAIGLLIGGLLAWYIGRSIVVPLTQVTHCMTRLADGDLDIRVEDTGRHDEVGALARAMATFKEKNIELASARKREQAMQAELGRVSQLNTMGQLTASIAHEVNQPLAAISANGSAALRFLGRTPPDLGETKQALSSMVSDSHRASQVITGLRAMFKKDRPEKVLLDVNDLIRDVLALLRGELDKNRVLVRAELNSGLPKLWAEPAQLQQVFLNLFMNSVEAMSAVTDCERTLTVRSTLQEPDAVLISVEDSGPGIDPGIIDRIFSAFFTTKSQGMGMGLSICRSIMEAHGGRLQVASGIVRGTAFFAVLPIAGVSAE
jgi:signal transduction histidine kinase